MKSADAVLFEELKTASGHLVGLMTLNVPKAMNAVDLAMVDLIDERIEGWNQNPQVVAIVMRGAGDKAFCAGGDIRQLYDSMMCEDEDQRYQYADDFFRGEYAKNYRLHQVTKPLIAWGHGFVMGGGLGLFIAANHRIGTESLRLAWPEVRIGLYPDVAATYYLSRLPFPAGHWMGLSGSHVNAADSKQLQLTQYGVHSERWQEMVDGLLQQNWGDNRACNHQLVRTLLTELDLQSTEVMPDSQLAESEADLAAIFACDDLSEIAQRMKSHKAKSRWVKQGQKNFLKACPATARLIMDQIHRGVNMSLKEVVSWELTLAYQAVRHPDFCEGVRAMVVDKDLKPKWKHKHVDTVPDAWLDELRKNPWGGEEHPYKDL